MRREEDTRSVVHPAKKTTTERTDRKPARAEAVVTELRPAVPSIDRRAWDARNALRCAATELARVERMAPAAGEPWAGAHKTLRKVALLTATTSQLAVNVTFSLLQGKGPPASDVALLDALSKLALSKLRKMSNSSTVLALRENPMKPSTDLVRDLRAIGFNGLSLEEWYGKATLNDGSAPPRFDRTRPTLTPPPGADRVQWLAEKGWLEGSIDKLVPYVFDILKNHGHLLGKHPPEDLKARLREELESVRQRQAKGEDKDVDSCLRAVFRAYGVHKNKWSWLLKAEPRRK
jgi:hypothetical protein